MGAGFSTVNHRFHTTVLEEYKLQPQRIHLIDGLRGLSLFGILLANLLIFQYGMFGKDSITTFSLSSLDTGVYQFLKIFIENSFMPIFTFLFGYAMIKMAEGIERNGAKVKRHFVRRFVLLLAIGLLHGSFLWEGDILSSYGLMGFFLLLFLNRKKKTLLIWGIILFVLTSALPYGQLEEPIEDLERMATYITNTNDVYANGTYTEIMTHRINETPQNMSGLEVVIVLLFTPLALAPLFLFGMYAARANHFSNPIAERNKYKIGTAILLPLGLLLKSVGTLTPENDWTYIFLGIGGPLLALGYICAFAYAYTRFSESMMMRAFENVGKLSLTNYLLQTVICTFVFYGYGLGQFGKLGVLYSIVLGLVIFGVQCVLSYWYLKYFRRGPLEFILRMWTNFSWSGRVKVKNKKSSYPHVDNQHQVS